MKTIYLLPCPCGRKIAVEPRQAGAVVACACGNPVDVPPMLRLKALERAPTELAERAVSSSWGVPQALMLLGPVIVAAALVAMAVLYWNRPVPPPSEEERIAEMMRQLQDATPVETMQFWVMLQKGLEPESMFPEEFYRRARNRYFAWLGVVAVVAMAGTVVLGVGLWKRGPRRDVPVPRRASM